MSRKRANWIDERLRQTTVLGESSALVANDIVANQPPAPNRRLVIVVVVSGGSLKGSYADVPDDVRVAFIEEGIAGVNPKEGARSLEVQPLSHWTGCTDRSCSTRESVS